MGTHVIDIGDDQYERESVESASSGLLRQQDRTSIELYELDEEQMKEQQGTVGPGYLIRLTLGTGG